MGKAAKTRAAEQRKKMKRSRKEQQRALYESYKKAGTNKKSKRSLASAKRTVKVNKHAIANCGNVGCSRCFPRLALQKMNDSEDRRVRFRTINQVLASSN